jgi:hypothetical protein
MKINYDCDEEKKKCNNGRRDSYVMECGVRVNDRPTAIGGKRYIRE